jgi:23S rRNA A2030 N6-methylase RlmJ
MVLYIKTKTNMKKKLKKLLEQNHWNITEEVIKEAMDYHSPKEFFEDLLQYGCQSWMVWSLIRYTDTHKFYDKHYDEIEELRNELADEGLEINIPSHSDLKNFFAWLSFEERARQISDELGLSL